MQVAVTCRHGSLNNSVHDHIVQKSEKLLTYFARVTAINVTVTFENSHATVEILVDAEHKHNFVSKEVGNDVQVVFDLALHKMEHQIHKYKEKIQDHRGGPALADLAAKSIEEDKS